MTYAAVAAKSSWFLGLAVNVIAAGNRKMKVTTRAILDLLLQGIAKRIQTGIPVSVTASAVTITRPRYATLGLSRSRTFRTRVFAFCASVENRDYVKSTSQKLRSIVAWVSLNTFTPFIEQLHIIFSSVAWKGESCSSARITKSSLRLRKDVSDRTIGFSFQR